MNEQKQNTQEIDLIDVISNFWGFLTRIFRNTMYFFIRNILLFALAIAISIILGLVTKKVGTPYFKSDLLCLSHTISNTDAVNIINNWNYKTSFTPEQQKKIKDIKAYFVLDFNRDENWDIIEEYDDKNVFTTDTNIINVRMPKTFCVRVHIYDTLITQAIKDNFLQFLTNNERVVEMNKIRIIQQKELIAKIKNEIKDLDSLKRIKYFSENPIKSKDLTILNEKQQTLFHRYIIELFEEKQEKEKELFLSDQPFEVIQDFTIPRYEENSLKITLKKYIINGFFISLLLILIIDNRKAIGKLIKESKKQK